MPAQNYDLKVIAVDQIYPAIPFNDLLQWVNEGRVAPRDFVRPTGQENWAPVTSVPEFAARLATFNKPAETPVTPPAESPAQPTTPKQPPAPRRSKMDTPLASPVNPQSASREMASPAPPAPARGPGTAPQSVPQSAPQSVPQAAPVAMATAVPAAAPAGNWDAGDSAYNAGPADMDEEIGASTSSWPKH